MRPMRLLVVARDNNEQGGVLTKLAGDLFHCLGYCDFIYDVPRSGREIDVIGRHRHEDLGLVAECKAKKTPAGGDDLNKFYGALDAERRATNLNSVGYFVSIAGFKGSAIAQESDLREKRIILIDGPKLIGELISGGVVVPPERAFESVTRMLAAGDIDGRIDDRLTLIAHSGGWVWQVYIETDHRRSHMCFLHADGRPLPVSDCSSICEIASIRQLPDFDLPVVNERVPFRSPDEGYEARAKYREYLLREYSSITLEGMPADHEVGAKSFKLEDLYVDLTLIDSQHETAKDKDETSVDLEGVEESGEKPIKVILENNARLAILGSPGAGKTTLLKRIAVHYAKIKEYRDDDWDLPEADWFPVVIKCRQLGDSARLSIIEIIGSLATKAEMPELSQAFAEAVRAIVRNGQLLLLVDGLDEIREASMRQIFVSQLRTFLATYPNIRLVLTSRETGYRVVASSVHSICKIYRVAHLSPEAITKLTIMWHRQVLRDLPRVEKEARELATAIISTDRVYRLAVNPLLLTTLLLVRRWVGQLPRKRSVLYDKAIDVLLMTWNVEGHEPIEREEAIPQLAYAAYRMMDGGTTSVSSRQLATYFKEARRDLPDELSYASLSVGEFLARVEERSSLLVLSGHGIEDGVIREIYEFKHLTFQEYLAATAIAYGYLPVDVAGLPIVDIIGERFGEDSWREVVSLAAVLARRNGPVIVNHLIKLIRESDTHLHGNDDEDGEYPTRSTLVDALISCLEDEVPLAPELVRRAIDCCITHGGHYNQERLPGALINSKYEDLLRVACLEEMERGASYMASAGSILGRLCFLRLDESEDATLISPSWVLDRLRVDSAEREKLEAGALMMSVAYHWDTRVPRRHPSMASGSSFPQPQAALAIIDSLMRDRLSPSVTFMYVWSLCWVSRRMEFDADLIKALRERLIQIWIECESDHVKRQISWLLMVLPIAHRGVIELECDELHELIERECAADGYGAEFRKVGVTLVAHYTGARSPREVANLAIAALSDGPAWSGMAWEELAKILGDEGVALKMKLDERDKARTVGQEDSQLFDPN
ncbi:NACHT domain-containing protein [Nonomuraea soli]|uniref:Energy-coupling factor transporter ATP-binding protein EcfA2 n=1 Tax=Nonomuraea soli TaxID=1032476 RepID=A0A7W0CQR2_9ACTN|nr:NACHT domain-containing protein [Nonomuraea soli]MBA2895454.1 energy-coupling factor transporter ATP-binding protein EcfA2 [Nonomuraea soli]